MIAAMKGGKGSPYVDPKLGTVPADASCAWSFDNGQGPPQTLTVEQPAHQRDALVQPVQPLSLAQRAVKQAQPHGIRPEDEIQDPESGYLQPDIPPADQQLHLPLGRLGEKRCHNQSCSISYEHCRFIIDPDQNP